MVPQRDRVAEVLTVWNGFRFGVGLTLGAFVSNVALWIVWALLN